MTAQFHPLPESWQCRLQDGNHSRVRERKSRCAVDSHCLSQQGPRVRLQAWQMDSQTLSCWFLPISTKPMFICRFQAPIKPTSVVHPASFPHGQRTKTSSQPGLFLYSAHRNIVTLSFRRLSSTETLPSKPRKFPRWLPDFGISVTHSHIVNKVHGCSDFLVFPEVYFLLQDPV